MKDLLLFVLLSLFIVGCSDYETYNAYYTYENDLDSTVVGFESYAGHIEEIRAFGLDSLFDTTSEKNLPIVLRKMWRGDKEVNSAVIRVSEFSAPYVLVRADIALGDSTEEKIYSLYQLVENTPKHWKESTLISATPSSSIRQMRVMQLIKDGYPYVAAERKSHAELKVALGGYYGGTGLFDLIGSDRMDAFSKDFSDAVMDDSLLMVSIADATLEKGIIKWSDSSKKVFLRGYVEKYLGVESCKNSEQRIRVTNKLSAYYNDSLVCDLDIIVYPRLIDSLDNKFGVCVNHGDLKIMECEDRDSSCYTCGMDGWRVSTQYEILNHYVFLCDSSKVGERVHWVDSIFKCTSSGWYREFIDFGYTLGECNKDNADEVKQHSSGDYYTCDKKELKWRMSVPGDILKTLPACEKGDVLRVEEIVLGTDTTYFECEFDYYHYPGSGGPEAGGFKEVKKSEAQITKEQVWLYENKECSNQNVSDYLYNVDLGACFFCEYQYWRGDYGWSRASTRDADKCIQTYKHK